MEFEKMTLEKHEGVVTLTLNNPESLNAMSTEMWKDLKRVTETVRDDDESKVMIMTGAGRAFCSGSDVKGRLAARLSGQKLENTQKELLEPTGYVAHLMRTLDIPIIAAINGTAAGAGLSLALLGDIRIASETARFSAVWVRVGLIGDLGATHLLPRIVGTSKALELLATGEMIDAREAERIGLVTRVVPPQELMPAAREMATRLANGPSVAIKLTKRAVYKGIQNDLLTQLDFESYAQNVCRNTEDYKEGVKAFIEKRKPLFQGI